MPVERFAAVDLGATAGRVVAVDLDGERLALREIHRFPNSPVRRPDGLHWDVHRMFADVDAGLAALAADARPRSVGVDSWGVDYALLDRDGALLGLPYSYRDTRTNGLMEEAWRRVPREEIFARTGVQFLPINTLYQLLASRRTGSPPLDEAATFLGIADLFHYRLCGARVCEFTLATTTQCFDHAARRWSDDLLAAFGLPRAMFPEVVEPGTAIGRVGPGGATLLDGVAVVAPGCHDTASAVAATPLASRSAVYISSGTWSLVGVEIDAPNTSTAALDANLTNEGGVGGTYRLLRNVMGLWLLEECRRSWQNESGPAEATGYSELVAAAERAEPFAAMFDPDDTSLLASGDMPRRILAACTAFGSGAAGPEPPAMTRLILEALALRYRWVVDRLAHVTGRVPTVIHVVGGGARNKLLCQFTADACGLPVLSGPVEATSLGNALVQMIAAGRIGSLADGRDLIRRSFPTTTFEPRARAKWEDAYQRFARTLAERG